MRDACVDTVSMYSGRSGPSGRLGLYRLPVIDHLFACPPNCPIHNLPFPLSSAHSNAGGADSALLQPQPASTGNARWLSPQHASQLCLLEQAVSAIGACPTPPARQSFQGRLRRVVYWPRALNCGLHWRESPDSTTTQTHPARASAQIGRPSRKNTDTLHSTES
jgi:hypothetical protein